MTETPVARQADRLTPDQLRELFLFADLTDEQLAWVSEHSDIVEVPAGQDIVVEGEPAGCFYVLLTGSISMSRNVGGETVETTRSDFRGAYFGAVQFYLEDESAALYPASVRAVTDSTVLALPRTDFAEVVHPLVPRWPGTCCRAWCWACARGNQASPRAGAAAGPGQASAGLTHELNNPGAAAGRAADALREKVSGMRHKLGMIATADRGPQQQKLVMARTSSSRRSARLRR
jgi:hypothetical protein